MSRHPATLLLLLLCAGAPALAQDQVETVTVEIEGLGNQLLPGDLLNNVRSALSVAEEPCDAPIWRLRRRFEQIDAEVARALKALGHYHSKVEKSHQKTANCWTVLVKVNPGPPTKVAAVDIDLRGPADSDPAFRRQLKDLPVKPGDTLHHGRYESIKSRLVGLAAERGYFDAAFCGNRLAVNPDKNEARIALCFDSGPRYKIAQIQLDQQAYDEAVIRHFFDLKSGEPYSSERLQENFQNLSNSGYFSGVDIRPLVDQRHDEMVSIAVKLTPEQKHKYEASVGFSTDSGPRLSAAYENRRVNTRGHRLGARLSLSQVINELGADYRIPLFSEPWQNLVFNTGYRREDTDDTESDLFTIGSRLTRTRGDWSETWSLDIQRERSNLEQTQWTTLTLPGVSWSRTRTDDLIRPTHGEKLFLSLKAAHDMLLSDVSLLQVHTSGKWVREIGSGLVIGRVELGATWTDEFGEVPASIRFFAGGDQSVRGYDYRTLGPKGKDGDLIGGRYLTALSLEYEHPLNDQWGAAVFVDSGNAYDSFSEGLKTGAGVGARWYSPVGPLRIDLAIPSDNAEDDFRVHISLGTIF